MTADAHLWAVVGATGTGKSSLSLGLAESLAARGEAAEIINADAMQLYRGMDIGTAKLSAHERRGIPHHLFDVLDVTEEAAVADYQARARATIDDVLSRGRHAILVGGSGLYVSSVIYDFRFPPRDPERRAALERRLADEGIGSLYAELRQRDAATAERIDSRNERRVVRALEVLDQGGTGHGAALPTEPRPWRETALVGLAMERAQLVERLDARVTQMWADGMLAETAELRDRGLEQGKTASRAIGLRVEIDIVVVHAQALDQLDGNKTAEEAIAETQALTRRYARRQVSWFKRYAGVRWFEAGAVSARDVLG